MQITWVARRRPRQTSERNADAKRQLAATGDSRPRFRPVRDHRPAWWPHRPGADGCSRRAASPDTKTGRRLPACGSHEEQSRKTAALTHPEGQTFACVPRSFLSGATASSNKIFVGPEAHLYDLHLHDLVAHRQPSIVTSISCIVVPPLVTAPQPHRVPRHLTLRLSSGPSTPGVA